MKIENISEQIRWKSAKHPGTTWQVKNGVPYLLYRNLENTGVVVHGFSTRLGGVSEGDCSSMNLSFSRGDSKEAVLENYRRISQTIGFPMESIVTSDQTHTVRVQRVGKADCGTGVTKERAFREIDGLITNEPEVTLATFYADCVPLYIVDPVKKAIGLSHSGWRGTVGNIGKVTVEAMKEAYGCDPKDMQIAIGPSICMDCYEVSEDVAQTFYQAYPESIWDILLLSKGNGKYQLNLWEACRQNFLMAGVPKGNIAMPEICTCCNPEFLFSHRASKGKRGNLAAFLMLKK